MSQALRTTLVPTRLGFRLDLLAPDPRLIFAVDIAEQLAKINRWSGATTAPFSVAQHCLLVAAEMARLDGPLAGLYGLMHDAHEPYIGDITITTENALELGPRLLTLRDRLDAAIAAAFDLDWPMSGELKGLLDLAHERVVLTERRDLMIGQDDFLRAATEAGIRPLPSRIIPFSTWTRADAEWRGMLERFMALAGIRRGRAFA